MADEIELKLENNRTGAFVIEEAGTRIAEMRIGISEGNLTVYHTEVSEKLKGKGVAARLLETMVAYARDHQLKVIPLCPYVSAQFKRHAEQYTDVWNQSWHK
jgi:predicted GNAT family acetyltransferase